MPRSNLILRLRRFSGAAAKIIRRIDYRVISARRHFSPLRRPNHYESIIFREEKEKEGRKGERSSFLGICLSVLKADDCCALITLRRCFYETLRAMKSILLCVVLVYLFFYFLRNLRGHKEHIFYLEKKIVFPGFCSGFKTIFFLLFKL